MAQQQGPRLPLRPPAPVEGYLPVRWEVHASWPLFVGIASIALGTGLQGTLVGVRASIEDFATVATGFVFSSYYLGFLLGSTQAPRILARVGHIRVFAALASLASAAVLLHAVFVEPAPWMVIRLATGFCIAGLLVTAESWLNGQATNENRGRLLAVYMAVMMGGMAVGQLLLNVADPGSFELFILVSVLVSVAAVPMALTGRLAPTVRQFETLKLRWLYRHVPLGVVGALGTGFSHGITFALGAVYGTAVGLSFGEISLMMTAVFIGAAVMQFPLGALSDHGDRRLTIASVAAAAATVTFVAALFVSPGRQLILVMALLGGTTVPLHSMIIAHANDYLRADQMTSASARLVFTAGVGAVIGPLVASVAMAIIGSSGFFWTLGTVHAAIALYSLYRITRRRAAPREKRGHAHPIPARGTPLSVELSGEVPVVR